MLLCAGTLGVVSVQAAEEEPFADMSFDEALKAAGEQKKMVFVDFYTTWCYPCKLLDMHTFPDEHLQKWLKAHTIPLKIDAEKEMRLADRYGVSAYPTLVFIKPDGTSIKSIQGFHLPVPLMLEGESVLTGEKPADLAKKKLAESRERILDNKGTGEDVKELAGLNGYLENPEATMKLYDELLEKHPDWKIIPEFCEVLLVQLMESRRYAELDKYLKPGDRADKALNQVESKVEKGEEDQQNVMEALGESFNYYEILVGVGRSEDAKKIGERMLALAPRMSEDKEAKAGDQALILSVLAYRAYRSGKVSTEHVPLARKAYELTEGKDASVIDTLVTVLDATGSGDEARKILAKGKKELTDGRSVKVFVHTEEQLKATDSETARKKDGRKQSSSLWGMYTQAWGHLSDGAGNVLIAFGPPLILLIIIVVWGLRLRRSHGEMARQSS